MMSKKITIPKKPNSDSKKIDDFLDQWVNSEQSPETKNSDLRIVKQTHQNDCVQCNILLPKELHQKIKVYCAANGLKISEKMREIIASYDFK